MEIENENTEKELERLASTIDTIDSFPLDLEICYGIAGRDIGDDGAFAVAELS